MSIGADGMIRIALSGEVDLALCSAIEPALEQAQSEVPHVVVDLARVSFMDSAGLHMLLEADARARRDGTRLVVARPPERVRRLLDLTDTLHLLTIDGRRAPRSATTAADVAE